MTDEWDPMLDVPSVPRRSEGCRRGLRMPRRPGPADVGHPITPMAEA